METRRNRQYGFDNIRFLLILLVVLGHLLELRQSFSHNDFLYRAIYACHMPVLLFIAGYFARYDRGKLIFSLLLPYLLFQTAYIFFHRWLYGTQRVLQYTTPYWLLWFLLALFFYHLLLPLYDRHRWQARAAIWVLVLGLSIAVGWEPTVGYGMTLSRFFVFQPWFLLGFYAQKLTLPLPRRPLRWLFAGCVTLLLGLGLWLLYRSPITGTMLYGSYSYAALGYGPLHRLFAAGLAILFILLLCYVLRPLLDFPIPLVSTVGSNTLPIFLFHGFIVKFIGSRFPHLLDSGLLLLPVTLGILLLLGNPLTRYLLPGYWLSRIKKRIN